MSFLLIQYKENLCADSSELTCWLLMIMIAEKESGHFLC